MPFADVRVSLLSIFWSCITFLKTGYLRENVMCFKVIGGERKCHRGFHESLSIPIILNEKGEETGLFRNLCAPYGRETPS